MARICCPIGLLGMMFFAAATALVSPSHAGLLSRPKRRPNSQRDYGVLGNLVAKGLDAAFGIKRNLTVEEPVIPGQNLSLGTGWNGTPTTTGNLTFGSAVSAGATEPLPTRGTEIPAVPRSPGGASTDIPASMEQAQKAPVKRAPKKEASPVATDEQEKAEKSSGESRERWRASADRFRKLVEPFLLNFKSPEEHIVAALRRLKKLEETERIFNPRYSGGLSEL